MLHSVDLMAGDLDYTRMTAYRRLTSYVPHKFFIVLYYQCHYSTWGGELGETLVESWLVGCIFWTASKRCLGNKP
jgi:hypothetical protein